MKYRREPPHRPDATLRPERRPTMRPNPLRTLWSEGRSVINGWLTIASGFAAETMAHQGWDSLTIDL